MTPKRIRIDLKEGVGIDLLLTPALYGVGKARGIDLVADLRDNGNDPTSITRVYTKMTYCAAINAWEVASVDDPGKGPFPYTFADFDAWSWEKPDDLLRVIDAFLVAFTGKGLKGHQEGAQEDVKKKMKK